jgi:hypothetical protein
MEPSVVACSKFLPDSWHDSMLLCSGAMGRNISHWWLENNKNIANVLAITVSMIDAPFVGG